MRFRHFLKQHRLLIALTLVALALRVWYLTTNPLWPQYSNADDGDYYQRALRFAVTGQYIDDAWLIRPPFHVWVFAAWLKLGLLLEQPPAFGVRLIQGFQVLLGTVMVPLCYALAARLFNRTAGVFFAGFWAIWFSFVELPATLFSEPSYLFLFTLHLLLLLRFDDTGRRRDLVLSGVVLGLAALTRSPALYALGFAVPWLLLRAWSAGETARSTWRDRTARAVRGTLGPFLILAVCTLAVVLPWTARNYLEYRQLILVDTLGPINLWLDLDEASVRNAKIDQLRALPQAERQAYATEQVKAILREDPLRPFRNVWPTFRHIWKAQYVEDYWVKRSFFTRPLREAAPLGLLGDVIWLSVTLAGVAGVLHPRTDRPFKVLLGLWLIYSCATVLVFHVEPRYLLSIWLLLGLYASWTFSLGSRWLRQLGSGSPWRRSLVYAALGGLLLLTITYRDYPVIVTRGIERERFMLSGNRAYARGDFAAAEQAYRRALEADPDFVDTEIALALALAAQGRQAQAIDVLTPQGSRRSVLVEGLLSRAVDDQDQARTLLRTIEAQTGEDTQWWVLAHVPVEPRDELVLGDDALDLGYIAGFAEAERSGARSYRWLSGRGTVVLPLQQPLAAGDVVQLELAGPIPLAGPAQLQINAGPLLTLWPDPDWRVYSFPVPPSLVGERELRLELQAPFHLPMADDPASSDARALSIMLHRAGVQRCHCLPSAAR